jgi:hypothetical protein
MTPISSIPGSDGCGIAECLVDVLVEHGPASIGSTAF